MIRIENVSKHFGAVRAVDDCSLEIAEGEFFALLGPSGCGKTTLLRMLAGFEHPGSGSIRIDGADMAGVPPARRPVNMVFQSYAVFPHMSVADNVGYGLRIAGTRADQRASRVAEALELVKLDGLGARMPDQLSGGQRQRVALARALVNRPRVLLLDEPLSALDAKLRDQMRFELARIQQDVGITFVMVTHDQDEALALADRCAIMRGGVLQQIASPSDLYEYPNNRFVADFIGNINLFEGRLAEDDPDRAVIHTEALGPVAIDHGVTGATGATVCLGIRPEKVLMNRPGSVPADNALAGVILHSAYLGSETHYEVRVPSGAVMKVSRPNAARFEEREFSDGDEVALSWSPRAPVVLLS